MLPMNKLVRETALALLGAVVFFSPLASETVEGIAAVVGDRIILASELTAQVQLAMLQLGQGADVDRSRLAADILQQMVTDELILSAARDDTSITASPEEIQAALDEHMAALTARFPSEEVFLQQLSREGWTKRSYEKRLRAQIGDQVLKQKIISRRLSQVTVSRQEVDEFFKKYTDSLPEVPAKFRLSHILVAFKVSPSTEDSVRLLAEAAREMIVGGTSFEDAAKAYPGAVGGRVGFIRKEELVAEFARAAFSLQPGSISGPVRTDYGWHIIESHNRLGDSVDVSQILLPLVPSAADSARAKTLIDSLYQQLQQGADFPELAKQYSDDDATRATGGEMEVTGVDQLRPEFIEPLGAMEPGRIAPPIPSHLGYHIIKLIERVPGHALTLDTDYDTIRNMARQEKTGRMVDAWVAELKKKVYIDIRNAG